MIKSSYAGDEGVCKQNCADALDEQTKGSALYVVYCFMSDRVFEGTNGCLRSLEKRNLQSMRLKLLLNCICKLQVCALMGPFLSSRFGRRNNLH